MGLAAVDAAVLAVGVATGSGGRHTRKRCCLSPLRHLVQQLWLLGQLTSGNRTGGVYGESVNGNVWVLNYSSREGVAWNIQSSQRTNKVLPGAVRRSSGPLLAGRKLLREVVLRRLGLLRRHRRHATVGLLHSRREHHRRTGARILLEVVGLLLLLLREVLLAWGGHVFATHHRVGTVLRLVGSCKI